MLFKDKLVRLRKIKSITQDEFAKAVGVSRQAVYKWECGQSYPEVQKLIEIKLLFGISIDDLLDDTFDIPLPEKKRRKRKPKTLAEEIELEVKKELAADKAPAAPKAAPVAPKAEPALSTATYTPIKVPTFTPINVKKAEPSAPKAAPVAPKAEPSAPKAAPVAPKAEPAAPAEAPKAEEEKKVGFFGKLFGRK